MRVFPGGCAIMDKVTLLEAALRYAELGLSVLPLKKDKTPYLGSWKKLQTTPANAFEINQWWDRWPDANIGIATGKLSGLFVIDFDSDEALAAWQAKYEEMPPGLFYSTGKGTQYWFKFESYNQGNKAAILEHVDLRGEGGYVMVPPSIHPNGRTYTWGNINPLEHGLDELSDMPEEMLNFCKAANKTPKVTKKDLANSDKVFGVDGKDLRLTPITWEFKEDKPVIKGAEGPAIEWVSDVLIKGAEKGARNATAARLVGWMVRQYADKEVSKEDMLKPILAAMQNWNTRVSPPLGEKELHTICQSIINRHSYDNISKAISSPIFAIQCLNRKIGDPVYIIYAAANKALRCSMEQLINLNMFRAKYAILTKKVIRTIKPDIWYELITNCLGDSEDIEEDFEESAISLLTTWLISSSEKNGDEKTKLSNGPVVLDEVVHVTVDAAVRYMQTTCHRQSDWDGIKEMFRRLGFVWDKKQIPLRVGTKIVKTWRISLKQLNNVAMTDGGNSVTPS